MSSTLDLEALHTPKSESQLRIPKEPKFSRCTIATTTLILLSATFLILIGSLKIDNCPAEPRIPIWMIIVGAFVFLERATALRFEFARLEFKKEHPKPIDGDLEAMKAYLEQKKKFRIRPLAVDLIWLVLLIYAIIGTIWLKTMPSGECDHLIFYPAAVYCAILLLPTTMGILCICTCCVFKRFCCNKV